jgi:hypothetical protein
MHPFACSFFCQQQIEQYIDSCKERTSCVLHIDATGSVVTMVNDQPKPLYYCALLSTANQSALPAFEFITCDNSATAIQSHFEVFNRHVRIVNNGKPVFPPCVVTDFSWALINSCLTAFNRCSASTYVKRCYKLLTGSMPEARAASFNVHTICIAHKFKVVANKPKQVEQDKTKRKLGMVCFSVLNRAQTLHEAARLYKDIHTLLCSPVETDIVKGKSSECPSCCQWR